MTHNKECSIWTFFTIPIQSCRHILLFYSIQHGRPWIQETAWDRALYRLNSHSYELRSNDKNSCSDYYYVDGILVGQFFGRPIFRSKLINFVCWVIVCNMLDVRVQMHGFNWKCPELSGKEALRNEMGLRAMITMGLNIFI